MKYRFVLGDLISLREEYPVITKIEDRFKHVYSIGKTGMGKTTLMERMAHYDISQGYSVIYIDPKGDSADKLYSIHQDNPKVKYVSFQSPMVINPLTKHGYDIDTIITEFVQVLDVLITLTSINPEATVRMKEIMYQTLKGFKPEDRNIEFLSKFLHFSSVRLKYPFNEEEIKNWWTEIDNPSRASFQKSSDYIRTMSSIESRLSMFLKNGEMRNIITGNNELDIDELVSENRSLIVNGHTPSIDNRIFLANLIVYAIYSYIYQKSNKKPLLVYIDEFQLVASDLIGEMLQISRHYQVGFNLSHQNFSIEPKILNSVISNANTYIAFRVGDEEASRFASIFNVSSKDLMNLSDYQAYVKIGTNVSKIECYKPLKHDKDLPEIINFLGDTYI